MLTHPRVLLAEEGLPLELAKLVKASYPDNITCQVCQALDNITCQVTCQALDVVNGIDGLEFAISPEVTSVVTAVVTAWSRRARPTWALACAPRSMDDRVEEVLELITHAQSLTELDK